MSLTDLVTYDYEFRPVYAAMRAHWSDRTDGTDRTHFPGHLCRAAFTILAKFVLKENSNFQLEIKSEESGKLLVTWSPPPAPGNSARDGFELVVKKKGDSKEVLHKLVIIISIISGGAQACTERRRQP